MTTTRAAVVAVVLAVVFGWSVLRLFGMQYTAGGFYPEYSSLRADPHGAKLLFESIGGLPGLRTERNYLPLDYFQENGVAVLLLGMRLEELRPALLAQVERIAGRGNRVVMALAFQEASKDADRTTIERTWKIQFSLEADRKRAHPFYIADRGEWAVLQKAGEKLLAVERKFGEGSVALFAESIDFTNEQLVAGDLAAVTGAIGPETLVVFDEQHFGIAESGSVVGLAKRFHLTGLAFGLVIVAALALWKNASAFPAPHAIASVDRYTGRTSFEGLVTLLQRHLRPERLAEACWEEWLKANRHQVSPDIIQEAASIAAGGPNARDAVRELQSRLHAKGEL